MKNDYAHQSTNPFCLTAPPDDGQEWDDEGRDDGRAYLPRGWQELLTGMPGARLFRIAPLNGGDTEWRAEMIIRAY